MASVEARYAQPTCWRTARPRSKGRTRWAKSWRGKTATPASGRSRATSRAAAPLLIVGRSTTPRVSSDAQTPRRTMGPAPRTTRSFIVRRKARRPAFRSLLAHSRTPRFDPIGDRLAADVGGKRTAQGELRMRLGQHVAFPCRVLGGDDAAVDRCGVIRPRGLFTHVEQERIDLRVVRRVAATATARGLRIVAAHAVHV